MMAFSTSPGLEMCDRSIFVLISSGAACVWRAGLAVPEASAEPRKWLRTFSASCSSRELECVFFSVTPTWGNTSRMALLLTSSSLAKSLIRILLIRLFVPPHRTLSLHTNLASLLPSPRPASDATSRASVPAAYSSFPSTVSPPGAASPAGSASPGCCSTESLSPVTCSTAADSAAAKSSPSLSGMATASPPSSVAK